MRVARLEAWGKVAIWLIHSETVLVSLVVKGNAALISTSAASQTCERKGHVVSGGEQRPGAMPAPIDAPDLLQDLQGDDS